DSSAVQGAGRAHRVFVLDAGGADGGGDERAAGVLGATVSLADPERDAGVYLGGRGTDDAQSRGSKVLFGSAAGISHSRRRGGDAGDQRGAAAAEGFAGR